MQLFKRISSTVLSSVDRAVSQIENHDAVVESMLKDLQHATAETKMRLRRVERDGKKMHQRLQDLTSEEQKWTERASACADNDEPKALACLNRRRQCREDISRLEENLKQHLETEKTLAKQQKKIEQRKNEITQQRHLMKSKEAMADARRVEAAVSGGSYGNVDDALDRWEIAISQSEYAYDDLDDDNHDSLEMEFTEREHDLDLQAELDDLKKSQAS